MPENTHKNTTTPLAGLRKQIEFAEALIQDKLPALAAAQLASIARESRELADSLGEAALGESGIHTALDRKLPPLVKSPTIEDRIAELDILIGLHPSDDHLSEERDFLLKRLAAKAHGKEAC